MAADAYVKEAAAILQRAVQQLQNEAGTLDRDADSAKQSMTEQAYKLETDAKAKEVQQSMTNDDQAKAVLLAQAQQERGEANDKKAQIGQVEGDLRRIAQNKRDIAQRLQQSANDIQSLAGDPALRQ